MPLEVRELVVKVNVGPPETAAPVRLDELEWSVLKREIVETCLAEIRLRTTARDER